MLADYRGNGPFKGVIECKWCGISPKSIEHYRIHLHKHHGHLGIVEIEKHLVMTRYPDFDFDLEIGRYRDRLETIIGFQRRGVFIKKYLKESGLLRNWRSDLALMRYIKPWMTTPEELKAQMTKELSEKFQSDQIAKNNSGLDDRGLDKSITSLKNSDAEELIPAVVTLNIIKRTRRKLDKAKTADTQPE